MKGLIKLIFWAAVAFFCWGWFSNVVLGGMTTSQYFHKLDAGFQQAIIRQTEKILKTSSVSRVIHNQQDVLGK